MGYNYIIYFVVCAVCGAAVAWVAQPFAHDNSDLTATIVTVMTVLAGFMIAIITVLGDPALIPDGSWRAVSLRSDGIEHRIIRHAYLFILYLLTIGFLFAGTIIKKIPEQKLWAWVPVWTDYAYLFLGVTSFLLSFGLPFSLKKIQLDRLKAEEERRRQQAPVKTITNETEP